MNDANSENGLPLNGGPLSVISSSGIPKREKRSSSLGKTYSMVVVVISKTTTNRDFWSITTMSS